MKRRNKLKLNKRLVAALAVLLAVGFAYISSAVNIGGLFTLSPSRYDIHFDNVQVTEGSVSATTPSFDSQHPQLDLSVSLTNPGDYYEFTIDAVNNGDIDGMLDTFSDLGLTEEQLAYLKYTVTYADGESLAQYQELNAGDTCTFKIRIEFRDDIPAEDLPQGGAYLDLGFDVSYVRADSNRIRRRAENNLYSVLKDEYDSGGLARKYNGEHQDSMDASLSTKDIYHWYADNDTDGTAVTNKNNVIFANHCWQLIRTTDTGGAKLLYNGEVENNQCLNTRGTHVGYASGASQNLASNYWYGTDYTYDSTAQTFKVSGTTEQTTWNATTGPGLIGKYTCKLTSEDGSCSTLYLVESYSDSSNGYVIQLNSNSNYSTFGRLQYNRDDNSPTYVGYMYGDIYPYSTTIGTASDTLTQTMLQNLPLATYFWYSDSINYDSLSTFQYSLVNPYKVSSSNDYGSLVGKYTLSSSNENYTYTSAQYIAAINNDRMYAKVLTNGNLLSDFDPIVFGNSITDNGDGTYTINNTTSVSLSDWYLDYSNYLHKYTCGDSASTCSNPRYLTKASISEYTYINAGEKITIGKTRNGLVLVDTLLVRKDELFKNSSNYGEYKYACSGVNTTCTENNLRMITGFNDIGYDYAPNHYYGSSVIWDGTKYTLVDPIEIENYNNLDNISTHHFICPNYGDISCSKVGYIYYYSGSSKIYYISLENGITTVSQALEDMFTKNTTNSKMKSGVDAWYKHYLFENYDDYIEDTIYCNDRSIRSLNGWNPNGGRTNSFLKFNEYTITNNLSCPNLTDRFSVSNSSAHLTFKIGLMSISEINILNNNNVRKASEYYWLSSPYYYGAYDAMNYNVRPNGSLNRDWVFYEYRVRPSISLSPKAFYTSGNGSMETPYVIYTE